MARASRLFTDEDKQAVKEAITEAEKETSGEIVPIVASRSGRYDRAEDIFGIVVGIIAVSVVWALFQRVQPQGGEWESGQAIAVGLGLVLLTLVIAFVVGVVLSTFIPLLARSSGDIILNCSAVTPGRAFNACPGPAIGRISSRNSE